MRGIRVSMLRSRRLAAVLIGALGVYSIVGTLLPQGPANDVLVLEWAQAHPGAEQIAAALGLHQAYSAPLFLILVAILVITTTACAWERTRRALRFVRSLGGLSTSLLGRLANRPEAAFTVADGVDPRAALAAVAGELESQGFRVRSESKTVDGRAGIAGIWGSPVFHWSLVALMLVAGIGRATRSEGFLALPLEDRVADLHESYLQVDDGPLFGERHTGVVFVAAELDRRYSLGGVEYGPTPLVAAYRDGTEVARGWVRPNSPLRVGSLMVHMVDFGPAVVLALETPDGAEIGRGTFTLDRSETTSSGTSPQEFSLSSEAGEPLVDVRVQVQVFRSASGDAPEPVSRAILETSTPSATSFGPPVVVTEGEALDLPGGQRIRVAHVKDWVRVSVANDWSVPFIYVLLLLATFGLGVAVLLPARRVSVLLVEDSGGWSLHMASWHSWKDASYKVRVAQIVREAARSQEDS